jgi:hypothetical protein
MSQDHNDPELDEDGNPIEPEDEGGIAALRKQAEAGKRSKAENLDLKKQVAFMKAGIDPDSSKVARGFYESFKGDVNDIAALKAEAVEWGLLKAEGEEPPPAADKGEEVDPNRAAEDARRAAVQDGLVGGRPGGQEAPTPHPRQAAMEDYQRDIRAGKDPKAAATDAFAKVLGAGAQGDRRVYFDADQHRADALEADRIAGRPSGVI